jgi:hypothetical protein
MERARQRGSPPRKAPRRGEYRRALWPATHPTLDISC